MRFHRSRCEKASAMHDFRSASLVALQQKRTLHCQESQEQRDADPLKPQSQKQVRTCINACLAATVCLASIKVSPYLILARPSTVKINRSFRQFGLVSSNSLPSDRCGFSLITPLDLAQNLTFFSSCRIKVASRSLA